MTHHHSSFNGGYFPINQTSPLPTNGTFSCDSAGCNSDSHSSAETGNGGRVIMDVDLEPEPRTSSSMALVPFSTPPPPFVYSVRNFKKSPSERLKDRLLPSSLAVVPVRRQCATPTQRDNNDNMEDELKIATLQQQFLERTDQLQEEAMKYREESLATSRNLEKVKQLLGHSTTKTLHLSERVEQLLKENKALEFQANSQNRWKLRAQFAIDNHNKVVLERNQLRKQNEELLRSRSDVIVCQRQDAPVELQRQYDDLVKNHQELQRYYAVLQQKRGEEFDEAKKLQAVISGLENSLAAVKQGHEALQRDYEVLLQKRGEEFDEAKKREDILQAVIREFEASLAAGVQCYEALQKENLRLQRELDWEKDDDDDVDDDDDDDDVVVVMEKLTSGNEFRIPVARRQYPKSKEHQARFPKTEIESFRCTCGISFKRERSLYMHLLLVNTDNPTLRCDYEDCTRTFDHQSHYQTHMEIKHNIYDGFCTSG